MRYSYRGGWGGPSHRAYGGYGGFGWLLTPTVKKLLIINAAVFVFSLLLRLLSTPVYVTFHRFFGLVPRDFLLGFHFWQPVTYLFLHATFWHLFLNMFALWMFGSTLERDWGRRRFLTFYFLTGVGAGLFSVLVTTIAVAMQWVPERSVLIPTIGASGAIYGILLAFGLLYPNVPVYFALLFPIPARIFVLIIGGFAFFSALGAPGSQVSHVAHLGGMLIGYLYLRGGWRGIYHRALNRYVDWRMRQQRRKFEVYMREQDEREREIPPHDRWIH